MTNERLKTEIKRHLAIASAKSLARTLRQMYGERAKELQAILTERGAE